MGCQRKMRLGASGRTRDDLRLLLGAEVHPRRGAAVEAIVGQVAVCAWVHLPCAMLRTLIESESVGVGPEVDSLGDLELALLLLSTEGSDGAGTHRLSPLAGGFAAVAAVLARTGAERIYVANWAEACRHVHFHLISRLPELADEFQGARIFDLMGGAQDRPAIAAQFELLTALRQHLTKEGIA